MVGLNFLLCSLICHESAFATVETGSFYLPAVNFSRTWLVGFDIGRLLGRGLSFACSPGHRYGRGLVVGILFLWCMGFAARSLASITAFVAASSIHGSIIAFCHRYHLVAGIFWSELGLNIAA